MAAKWRIKVFLKTGATVDVEAEDVTVRVEPTTGELGEFELQNGEGPQLAWVDLATIAAIVLEELERPSSGWVYRVFRGQGRQEERG
jgi:hypothetical protein